jgi:thiol-disulfide isomerase/thioredoxin
MRKISNPLDFSTLGSILWVLTATLLLASPAWATPSFVDINGDKIDLESYRGKWIVVNYWATWCPPCREEIPELIHFHDTHKDNDAVVIGINMEETTLVALSSFVDDNMMSYPIVPMRSDMPLIGNIPGLPTTYMIDPSGRVVAQKVGQVTTDMLESYIKNNTK